MSGGVTYKVEAVYGSVELSRPIGVTQDPDGWWRHVMSDCIHRDAAGNITKREPCDGFVRWRYDDSESAKPWWRFWP